MTTSQTAEAMDNEPSGRAHGAPLFCESQHAQPATERSPFDGDAPGHNVGATSAVAPRPQPIEPNTEQLYRRIVETLKQIYDPEIPVNIYDLGLIYDICIYPLGRVVVHMTLTSPACPVAGSLPPEVEQAIAAVESVSDSIVELVWDPPWSIERMTEEARLELNLL